MLSQLDVLESQRHYISEKKTCLIYSVLFRNCFKKEEVKIEPENTRTFWRRPQKKDHGLEIIPSMDSFL